MRRHQNKAITIDLSKSFASTNHNLLLAKLVAYGARNDALHLRRFYLTERKQDLNINDSWSEWKFVKYVPSTFRVNLQKKLGLLTSWFRKDFLAFSLSLEFGKLSKFLSEPLLSAFYKIQNLNFGGIVSH